MLSNTSPIWVHTSALTHADQDEPRIRQIPSLLALPKAHQASEPSILCQATGNLLQPMSPAEAQGTPAEGPTLQLLEEPLCRRTSTLVPARFCPGGRRRGQGTRACSQIRAPASSPAIAHRAACARGRAGERAGVHVCVRGSLCAHSVCFSHGFISEDCFRAWSQVLSSSGNYAFLGGSGRELGV